MATKTLTDQARAAVLGVIKDHPYGKPISQKEITDITGVSDAGIRTIVNEARRNERPICSSGRGYSWATHPAHLHATQDLLESHRDGTIAALEGLNRAEKQLRIDQIPDEDIDIEEILR